MKKVVVALLVVVMAFGLFAGCKKQAQPVTLTIWHAWSGSELEVLNAAISEYQKQHPEITINQLQVPFDQLQNKYQTEAASGGGPDILVGAADWIGPFTKANLIAPLDSYFDSTFLADFVPGAIEQVKYQGKMMAFPESTECVALMYNKSLVQNLPKDTNELIAMVDSLTKGDTYGFVYNSGFYFTAGYFFAGGMQLFDANYNSIVNQGNGGVIALNFLKKIGSDTHFIVANDYAKADSMFKEGKAAMIINGPWAAGDYQKALGDNFAVAPMPALSDTGNPFAPFVNTKDFFLNANISDSQKQAAIDFIKFMVSPEIEKMFFEKASHIPSNTKVDTSGNAIISGFIEQMKTGVGMPIAPEMSAVWDPMQTAIDSVLTGKATPQDAINTAQKTIQGKIDAMRGQ